MTSFGSAISAGYGSDGLRDWKSAGGTQTYFVYDGVVPVLELNAGGSVIAVTTSAGDTPLTRHDASGSVFYAFDPMGGLAHRMDSTGTVLSSHAFDAFGAPNSTVATTDPYACFNAASGYRNDPETGLVATAFRYYDPSTGRFVNRDPVGLDGGPNLYRHADNDPIDLDDPLGMSVGQPGFAESLIPVWGSGRAAIDDFQNGNYGMAAFNTALAVSDVFVVGDLAKGIGKVGIEGMVKFSGSNAWKATRSWMARKGWQDFAGQQFHHWLIPQRTWGTIVPDIIKNQPWNLFRLPEVRNGLAMDVFHDAIEGKGPAAYGALGRILWGTPPGVFPILGSTLGHILNGLRFCH